MFRNRMCAIDNFNPRDSFAQKLRALLRSAGILIVALNLISSHGAWGDARLDDLFYQYYMTNEEVTKHHHTRGSSLKTAIENRRRALQAIKSQTGYGRNWESHYRRFLKNPAQFQAATDRHDTKSNHGSSTHASSNGSSSTTPSITKDQEDVIKRRAYNESATSEYIECIQDVENINGGAIFDSRSTQKGRKEYAAAVGPFAKCQQMRTTLYNQLYAKFFAEEVLKIQTQSPQGQSSSHSRQSRSQRHSSQHDDDDDDDTSSVASSSSSESCSSGSQASTNENVIGSSQARLFPNFFQILRRMGLIDEAKVQSLMRSSSSQLAFLGNSVSNRYSASRQKVQDWLDSLSPQDLQQNPALVPPTRIPFLEDKLSIIHKSMNEGDFYPQDFNQGLSVSKTQLKFLNEIPPYRVPDAIRQFGGFSATNTLIILDQKLSNQPDVLRFDPTTGHLHGNPTSSPWIYTPPVPIYQKGNGSPSANDKSINETSLTALAETVEIIRLQVSQYPARITIPISILYDAPAQNRAMTLVIDLHDASAAPHVALSNPAGQGHEAAIQAIQERVQRGLLAPSTQHKVSSNVIEINPTYGGPYSILSVENSYETWKESRQGGVSTPTYDPNSEKTKERIGGFMGEMPGIVKGFYDQVQHIQPR